MKNSFSLLMLLGDFTGCVMLGEARKQKSDFAAAAALEADGTFAASMNCSTVNHLDLSYGAFPGIT
jgi:hypothetical protein